jgi:hypothetical protein
MYADGKGNFFVDEDTAKKFNAVMSLNSNSQSSTTQSVFKDITFLQIVIILSLVVLALFLEGNSQYFILGALVLYIGVLL